MKEKKDRLGFLHDSNGDLSSARLMEFVSILMACIISVSAVLTNQIESSVPLVITFIGCATGLKAFDRFTKS